MMKRIFLCSIILLIIFLKINNAESNEFEEYGFDGEEELIDGDVFNDGGLFNADGELFDGDVGGDSRAIKYLLFIQQWGGNFKRYEWF